MVHPKIKGFLEALETPSLHPLCLLQGVHVVVPEKLQKVLDKLHMEHLGSVKIKNKACSHVWWPGIDLGQE